MEKLTFEFTGAEMAVINEGLMQVPYGKAAPVVNGINAQIQAAFNKRKDEEAPSGATPPPDEGRGD
ncbi:hypothetical protein [Cupriavidus sp. CuC1]|uniref:hypothetical protein n=1 Tax=Cupriavidus sp. CuC1 TaxID=3373131 RepID=UPI0037D1A8C3